MNVRRRRIAFTLIEVLVVVAIIALLVAILLPSLASARYHSKLAACQSNLHQLGVGIVSYANEQRLIPFGPTVDLLFSPFLESNDGRLATNQIWTGPQVVQPESAVRPQRMSLGLLMAKASVWPRMMYCPDDDTNDPQEELAKVLERTDKAAYSSYLYRQLQETNGKGRLEDLGLNSMGGRATALALDINSLLSIAPDARRTNHKAGKVNVLYRDGSARGFDNAKGTFSLRDQDLVSGPQGVLQDLAVRRAQILQEADRRY
ncbi:MAG: type II secretion system protein [Planctomycetes bacterium]|nr:type II secretion system protein [Planctomycetota bacterium]